MEAEEAIATVYDIELKLNDGTVGTLSNYKGKVLLIVNTASECGFTSQYKELEALYQQYQEREFAVLAFPCNQFGGQEPGSDAEIAKFCSLKFNTTFPLFSKVDVNGDQAHPLFRYLKAEAPGLLGTEAIKWNFTKFLVDREGRVVERFAPKDAPSKLSQKIEVLL